MAEIINPDRVLAYARKAELEALLTPEVLPNAKVVIYPAGRSIMVAGDPIHQIQFLIEGTLCVYSIAGNGKQGIVARVGPPQILGDIEYIQNVHALHSVKAESAAALLCIPIADVKKYLSENIIFYRLICANLIQKLYETSSN